MFFGASHKKITPDKMTADFCRDATIIDVRTDKEHTEACLEQPHIHIPMDLINADELVSKHGLAKDSKLLILCLGGKRAAAVAETLGKAGFSNVHVIEGGIMGCQACGQPIKKN